MRKLLLFVFILFAIIVNPISLIYAKTKITYQKAEGLALQYIKNSIDDENWKNNNPKIEGEGKYFYNDNENNPGYIEFKVSCYNNLDCGFILVNIDGDDVAVPISSTIGNTPSEVVYQESNEKLYYFGPLDIYSENIENGEVQTINIAEQVDLEKKLNRTERENEIIINSKKELKNKLNDMKIKSRAFKKSDDFRRQKEEIKDQILKIPNEKLSMKILPMANADLPDNTNTYVSPGSSDTFILGSSTSDCSSRTPCYNQFTTSYTPAPSPYTSAICYSGCSPTAVAILFGYYDRQGSFTNLVSGTAPSEGTGNTVQTLVNNIKTYIGTTCVRNGSTNVYYGNTTSSNVQKAKQYAIDKGYKSTTSSYLTGTVSSLFSIIKSEINAQRPIITHMKNSSTSLEGHATVTYGYKKSPSNSNIVRMNMGWGNCKKVNNVCTLYYSTLDQNLSAISYGGPNDKVAYAVTKFTIKP